MKTVKHIIHSLDYHAPQSIVEKGDAAIHAPMRVGRPDTAAQRQTHPCLLYTSDAADE